MRYSRLTEYLSKEAYQDDILCPCVFIKRSPEGFAILAVYVDDINLIGTSKRLTLLLKEIEIKDLGETKLCPGLQIERYSDGILVHQKKYTNNILNKFNLEDYHNLYPDGS